MPLGQAHQSALVIVGVDEALGRRAGELADERALRGYDAVHLARALALATGETILATWDRDLSNAAADAGLAVRSPSDHGIVGTPTAPRTLKRGGKGRKRPMGRFDRYGSPARRVSSSG